jgi:hypothetical protein
MNGMHRSWKEKPEGSWLAPCFVIGSRIIDGPKPGFGWSVSVKNEEDARKAVREMTENGYDFIKVLSLLSSNIYYAIVDECNKLDISFAGHIENARVRFQSNQSIANRTE